MSSGHDNHKSHFFNDKKEQQFVPLFTGGANSVCSSKLPVFVNIDFDAKFNEYWNIGLI